MARLAAWAAAVKRAARYALSWLVTLMLMGWVLQRVPWADVWGQWTQIRPGPVIVACLLSVAGNAWAACAKYRLILELLGTRMSLWEVVLLKMGSLPLKNLLPLKSGEIVRVIYLRRTHGLSYGRGVASVAVNMGLGVGALGLVALPGLLGGMEPAAAWIWGGLTAAALAAALGALEWFKRRPRTRAAPGDEGHVRSVIRTLVDHGAGGLARLLGYSLAFAGIRLVNYGLIFSALGVSVPWDALSRKVPFLILLSDLPVSVMGIGVREGGVLMAFSDMGSEVNLVSAGLWVSVVEGIVPLVLGLLLLKPFLNRLLNGEAPPRPGLGRRSVMRGCTGPLQGVRDAVQSHFDRRAEAQAGRDAGEEAPRQFVRSLLARRVRGRTLELGCGFHPSARPPGTGPLVALDLSPASLRRLGAGVARVCADACALPFATGAFETVVSMHMVHHLAGRSVGHGDAMLQGTLAEVQRVLRPGGSAVVVDTLISGGLYGVQRFCYPLLQRVAGALGGVPVMFRDTRAVTAGLARAGLPVEETRVLPVLGKALTPWGGSLQWPMGLSPLRDVMVVAARRGGP